MATSTPHRVEDGIGYLLVDTARLLRRDFDRRAQAHGLTQAQCRVIGNLSRNPGISQAALAEAIEVTPITLARLIDRMAAAGLVERRPHPQDRRAVQLFLTDRCQPLRANVLELGAATKAAALEGLTADEIDALRATLSKIKSNLSETAPIAAASIRKTA